MKRFAPLFILLAGVLWGSMGIFVRHYDTLEMSSLDIVAVRSVVTLVLMTVFLLLYDRKLFRIHLKDIWCFLGTGLLSILFFNLCYFQAITETSLSVAAVLLYTAPAFVMGLSAFLFKEKFTLIKGVSFLATFIGCIFVTGLIGSYQPLSIRGILLGLGAGLGYALYSIFSRYALEKGYHIYTIIVYTFFITTIGVLPFTGFHCIYTIVRSGPDILFALAFGIVSTVLPYILYTLGLRKVENGTASIIASVEPVVATVIGVILFHEELKWNIIVGMVLILGAILLCNLKRISHITKE